MMDYEQRRDFALRRLPALARNPLELPNETCVICAAPTSGYTLCFQCSQQSQVENTADLVVPLTYAGSRNRQMRRDLFNYKGTVPSVASQATSDLAWLVWWSGTHHMSCIERVNGSVDSIATVPSRRVNQRPAGHPLEQLAFYPGEPKPRFRLERVEDQPDRVMAPQTLRVPVNVQDQHVLLYDDTWTTGSNAQGASQALKGAGAAYVTVIVIGRWLHDGFGPTDKFLKLHGDQLWSPHLCPVTRGPCPP